MRWVNRKAKLFTLLMSYSKAFQGRNKIPRVSHYPAATGGLSAGSLWLLTQTVLSFACGCPTPTLKLLRVGVGQSLCHLSTGLSLEGVPRALHGGGRGVGLTSELLFRTVERAQDTVSAL